MIAFLTSSEVKYTYVFNHQVNRYVIIDGGWLYVVRQRKADQFTICSVNDLKKLTKVLMTEKEKKFFFFLDFNNGKSKTYNFQKKENWNLFMVKLKSELQRIGYQLQNY